MILVVVLIGLSVSCIILHAMNNAYKSDGKEDNKLTVGKIILWLILGQVFAFGCLCSILDPSSGDLSIIGGR